MGGSGGSAGQVNYPAYLEEVHSKWIDDEGSESLLGSMVGVMNTGVNNNPFLGRVAYNPDTDLSTAFAAVTAFNTLVDALSHTTDYTTAYNHARSLIALETATLDTVTLDTDRVNNEATAYDTYLTDQLEDVNLPAFQAGMLNINAVQSSSFVMGEAIMRAYKDRDVAKYASDLRLKMELQQDEINARHRLQYREIQANHIIKRGELVRMACGQIIQQLFDRVKLENTVAALTVETKRITIVAKKEQANEQAEFDEDEARWPFEVYQYGANLLASPSGGVGHNQKRINKALSAVGGALSGAASGASIGASTGAASGGYYGAAIGAIAGAALGYFSAQ